MKKIALVLIIAVWLLAAGRTVYAEEIRIGMIMRTSDDEACMKNLQALVPEFKKVDDDLVIINYGHDLEKILKDLANDKIDGFLSSVPQSLVMQEAEEREFKLDLDYFDGHPLWGVSAETAVLISNGTTPSRKAAKVIKFIRAKTNYGR